MPPIDNIMTQLRPLFEEILDVSDIVLTREMSAQDVPEWDSLNHIRLISAIEQEFKIRLSATEVEKLACVGDMADLIATKIPA